MCKNQLSEAEQQFIKEFSAFVNGKMSSPKKVGADLASDHRYLVNEKAKIAFSFLETLAVNYEKDYYDERNEWACRLAWETISHLESMELYHRTIY